MLFAKVAKNPPKAQLVKMHKQYHPLLTTHAALIPAPLVQMVLLKDLLFQVAFTELIEMFPRKDKHHQMHEQHRPLRTTHPALTPAHLIETVLLKDLLFQVALTELIEMFPWKDRHHHPLQTTHLRATEMFL